MNSWDGGLINGIEPQFTDLEPCYDQRTAFGVRG
jgi:hypothetical protein